MAMFNVSILFETPPNIYSKPSDIYAPANADEIASLLPNAAMTDSQLIQNGKLPAAAMFQLAPTGHPVLDSITPSTPTFGFDTTNYLIKNDYRLAYVTDMQKNVDWALPYLQGNSSFNPIAATSPAHPLRKALKANDLRGYLPKAPVIMCGGNQDPMVFFDVNSSLMNTLWQKDKTTANKLGIIDIDILNQQTRQKPTYETVGFMTINDNAIKTQSQKMQAGFAMEAQHIAQSATATGKDGSMAVLMQYHSLVTPYCMGVAQILFNQF